MAGLNISELMHAHPLLTVGAMTAVVFVVFLWALFAGSHKEPQVEDIQAGGDWQFPPKQKESA